MLPLNTPSLQGLIDSVEEVTELVRSTVEKLLTDHPNESRRNARQVRKFAKGLEIHRTALDSLKSKLQTEVQARGLSSSFVSDCLASLGEYRRAFKDVSLAADDHVQSRSKKNLLGGLKFDLYVDGRESLQTPIQQARIGLDIITTLHWEMDEIRVQQQGEPCNLGCYE